ncbi:MAG: hypothetical protein U9Q07_08800, partial [Planctomycetota bacterium]|nr:hypothetical protein [Planctomycetota bacterium]
MREKFLIVLQLMLLILAINVRADCSQSQHGAYYVTKKLPSEKASYHDSVTGVKIVMLTTSAARDNKIYQTHPNWTADGRHVVFMSGRSGTNQYFAVSPETGTIVQLTNDKQPGNAFLSRTENRMYYMSGRTIWDADIDSILRSDEQKGENTFRRKVADLPDGVTLSGSTSVDSNGKDIYMGVKYDEDSWGLLALDAHAGKFRKIIDSDFRVGHCQAHPSISGLIMYCWETGGDSQQRMW